MKNNMMYKELITALRKQAIDLPEKFSKNAENIDLFMKAADAIESTNKAYQMISEAYEAEVTKQNWIPVTKMLPENIDDEVLVCTEDYGKSCLGFVTVAIYDGSGWLECWKRKTYLTAVTHWMPLPKPPQEE